MMKANLRKALCSMFEQTQKDAMRKTPPHTFLSSIEIKAFCGCGGKRANNYPEGTPKP